MSSSGDSRSGARGRMTMSRDANIAQALLAPRSIALIGASGEADKHGSLPQRYLREHGYSGELYPINPRYGELFGERAYPVIGAVPVRVDHAFILLPTQLVLEAVVQCADAGVRCATILGNGFAESGDEGRIAQERLVEIARAGAMRVLGPNSLGIINLNDRVALSANEVLSLPELRAGSVALISQSGSLMGALLSRGQERGVGFSKMVSVGNEADLSVAEIGEMLLDDPDTKAVLLILETVRDAAAMAAMARRAFDLHKPLVAMGLWRSVLTQRLAASHTGAMTADGAALEAYLADLGVVRVSNFETLFEITPLLIGRQPAKGRRVAVMTTSGGGAELIADALSSKVEMVPPDDALRARLAELDIEADSSPVIDLTLAGTNAKSFGGTLTELLASSHCDLVLAIAGSSAQFRPDRTIEPIVTAARKTTAANPLAVFLTPEANQSLKMLQAAGVASFRTPESCADAVNAYLNWKAPRPLPSRTDHMSPLERAIREHTGSCSTLDASQSAGIFAALGIAQARELIVSSGEQVDQPALSELRFPVAVKLLSQDVSHKSDVGGVILNLRTVAEVRRACDEVLASVKRAAPLARIAGLQVQSMESGLAEVLLGYCLDPRVGPLVMLAAGGIAAELYSDRSLRTAPIDLKTAHEMIGEVRGLAVIKGFRSLPPGDVNALGDALVAISKLALAARSLVQEAEINPLLVLAKGEGVIAVDGFVRLADDKVASI